MVKKEQLEGGVILKALIKRFHENQTKQNAFAVLHCLRDSNITIPCTIEMSERDQEKFFNVQVGDEIAPEDDVRYIPDILNNGQDDYFPVFSSEEEMGEYGKQFSKVEQHFLGAISLAKANEKVKGIVVNAFTEQFLVDKDLFDFVARLPSNVEDDLNNDDMS